ncbi:PF04087 domain protein [Leptospira interrogans serovar Bataviae str. HAI135]|nr:PF04087 domain protein [Leptospira interrogans serovar Bataviae str. HAI135]
MQKKTSSNPEPNFWDLLGPLFEFINPLFHIRNDTDESGTIESIKRGVNFSGSALWTLIFAIFIASIGLNINSTAVIIGAMLISPLMGPIMGAGLALGIYDFELLKKSLRNLAVMTFLSLFTSALYFLISPLSDAQSELLARTSPTIYDVLIAFIGGATGIVAGSRKDKISNAIPGVAIATALMPPLCTAGYGLANWNFKFS